MRKALRIIKKVLTMLGTVLTVVLTVLATILCFSIQWMFDTWSNLTMDELVYHLTAPLDGTNEGMIMEYLNTCVAPTLLVLVLILMLFIAWRKKKKYYVVMGVGMIASLAVSTIVVRSAWTKLDAGSYVKAQGEYSDFIDDYYVDPAEVEITFPEKKRNLIFIFLESMETTYADTENGGAFEENVIPELTKLAQENEDFSGEEDKLNGGYSMPGTTWTIGAMFAHTSGLPLSISIDGNNMDTQDSFFPSAITLGDVLEREGYSQTLMIGSDATFGGRRLYFTEHGNYDIVDYNYAIQSGMIPEDYQVWWGYEDQKLFGFAKEKLLELSSQEEPFNLTMLTVDTHFEDGYVCDICPETYGDEQYSNVMSCSSRQVYDFIQWIQEQDFYENTSIVIVGDHPTMDVDYCEDVEDDYIRKVYTSYINSAEGVATNEERDYTTFDTFPTTLAALGANIEGNRLGLGTNLFSTSQTLTERLGINAVKEGVSGKSKRMEELASIDETKEELLLREGKLPMANAWVEAYERETGALPVVVTDIANIPEDISQVMIAVWTNEDQSDLQWIGMEQREDGSYYARVNVSRFGYKLGEYQIHVYVVGEDGVQYKVTETIGNVN
ncbi:GBS Bsp-like repeat-containing protein [Bariatricus sp. SGI.161]|uniref:GBS Bsp-like repeat-containing protein n=1 Tax=Bariatricus sp. SGI.161 TaxID=3420550 RepID=UPI00302AFCCA|nr:GBS Bsp-like repeat-containing protein [Lachnospiraceae bacterium]